VPAVGLGVLPPAAQHTINRADLGADAVTLDALRRAPGAGLLIALDPPTFPQVPRGGEQHARCERTRGDRRVHIPVTQGATDLRECGRVRGVLREQFPEPVRGGFDGRLVPLGGVQ
jgi:hypothetical protein